MLTDKIQAREKHVTAPPRLSFCLKKKYGNKGNLLCKSMGAILATWSEKEDNKVHEMLHYTRSWLEKVDRGGLT